MAASTIANENDSTETRAGRMRRSRPIMRLLTTLTLVAAAFFGIAATNANAAINRGYTHAIAGTNCSVTVGGWLNTSRYPATASQVSCSSRHTVQVRNQLWYAGTNGVPALFFQTQWYTYQNAFGTREIDSYAASCPGRWDWLSGVQVYIDGVNRGSFYNTWGWWTACT
jgi:hypothetical protein